MPPRIFVIAGEESGDVHGAALVRELRALEPRVEVEGFGGRRMAEAGCRLHLDLVQHAVMGVAAVVRNVRFFRRVYRDAVDRIRRTRPDLVVPIDYPGLNLRIARAARAASVPVLYYVSPQVWAWLPHRIRKIARSVDKMLVLFPFEERLYLDRGIRVEYVGHSVFDAMAAEPPDPGFRDRLGLRADEPLVALLPGSRAQEVDRLLPLILDAAALLKRERPAARFAVPCARPAFVEAVRRQAAARGLEVAILEGEARAVVRNARVAIVASGTATLEGLYFGTPMVVVYRVNPAVYALARLFLKTRHIGMVNILGGDRDVVPELLSFRDRPQWVADRAVELLDDGEPRRRVLEDLAQVRAALGERGASRRAALAALSFCAERMRRRNGHA